MQVNTRFGTIQTERTLTVDEFDPTRVEVTERFRVGTMDGLRDGVARRIVVRDVYTHEPTIVDEQLARDIQRMIDDLAVEVRPEVPRIDLGGLPPGGYQPPRPLAPTIEEILRPPMVRIERPVAFRLNEPVRMQVTGGYATTDAVTWTATNGTAVGGRALSAQAIASHNAKVAQQCSCGHSDDPNWEHGHDECTFLDRPSSQWRDEGRDNEHDDEDDD